MNVDVIITSATG